MGLRRRRQALEIYWEVEAWRGVEGLMEGKHMDVSHVNAFGKDKSVSAIPLGWAFPCFLSPARSAVIMSPFSYCRCAYHACKIWGMEKKISIGFFSMAVKLF